MFTNERIKPCALINPCERLLHLELRQVVRGQGQHEVQQLARRQVQRQPRRVVVGVQTVLATQCPRGVQRGQTFQVRAVGDSWVNVLSLMLDNTA